MAGELSHPFTLAFARFWAAGLSQMRRDVAAVLEQAEATLLRGVLLLQQSIVPEAEAEGWLHRALDVTQSQQAKSLELRAATSLARLWHAQGKDTKARDLLSPVCRWFSEGLDTIDLKDAKALLAELGP